jgi:hypothetical protein
MTKPKYLLNISPKVWTIVSAWFHVFIGAILAEYILHQETSIKGLWGAGLAALAPLVYRYVNPADTFPLPNKGLIAADNAVKE